jgi:hypothetical protein
MTVFGQARRQNGRQAARAAAGHAEENLLDHPFPRQVLDQCGVEYGDFDHRYFDEPTVTGFSGYFAHGNGAEGPRDFSDEARRIAAIPGVRSVLDVGCAKGFLVRELRAVGVEAWGIDVSGYAISRADEDTRPWLSVGSLRDIGSGVRYDLCHVCGVLVYLRFSEIRETLRRLHRTGKRDSRRAGAGIGAFRRAGVGRGPLPAPRRPPRPSRSSASPAMSRTNVRPVPSLPAAIGLTRAHDDSRS